MEKFNFALEDVLKTFMTIIFLFLLYTPLLSAEGIERTYLEGKKINDIAVDGAGTLWVSASYLVYRFVDNSFEQVFHDNGSNVIAKSFHVDDQGAIWFVGSPIWKYDGFEWTQYGYDDMYTQCIETTADGQIWAGTYDKGLMHFDGETWTQYTVDDGLPSNEILSLAIDKHGLLWLGSFSQMLTSFDGETFSTYSSLAGLKNLEALSMLVDSRERLWVLSYSGMLLNSNGEWSAIKSSGHDIAEGPNGLIYTAWGVLFDIFPKAIHYGGIQTIDPNNEYTVSNYPININLLSRATYAVFVDIHGNLWQGTYEGLIRYSRPVFVENDEAQPRETVIIANYPNPFNPSTSIEVFLPTKNEVEMAVYNIAGQKMYSFSSNSFHQGLNQVAWNGKNDNGDSLSSGMYFIKVTVDHKSHFHKMFFIK